MHRLPVVLSAALLSCGGASDPNPTPIPVAEEDRPEPQKAEVSEDRLAAAKTAKAEREAKRKTYSTQLADVDRKIEGFAKIAKKNASSLPHRSLASQYMTRARLTGNYDDYAKAEAAVAKAFETTPQHYGPFMARARLNYTLHRLDRVDEDFAHRLREKGKKDTDRASDASFAAKLAAQRGDYETAKAKFVESLGYVETYGNLTSLAVFKWKNGEFEEAEALFNKALPKYHAKATEPIAWIHLMAGLMDLDRGRYDEALVHYKMAESFIKGYWLIDEHIAEILTLQGKTDEAKALYLDIIERTNSPEFMDAMAGIHLEAGEDDKAKEFIARASKRYEEQMAVFPEAAYGHALDHYLEFGEDPAQTLDLAKKNHALRPNSEAKMKLAAAQLGAGKVKSAVKTITAALATPYTTADLHLTAAEVFRAAGDAKASEEQLAKAKAINPKAELAEAEEG